MANRWPISSGNWSNFAIWSGSIIPTASDDVYANNQTVTIDQNITVTSLRNSATTGVTAGGRFVIVDNYTINASTIVGSVVGTVNPCLAYTGSNGCTINGTIAAGAGSTVTTLELSGNGGTINISGSLPNTTGANQFNIGVTRSNQIINFTGSITATALDNRNRVFNITAGPNTYNILGNITSSGCNVFACNGAIVNINITGSMLSTNSGLGTYVVNTPGAGSTINLTGSITGLFLTTTALHTTRITGTVSAVPYLSSAAISDTSAGILYVNGPVSSSTAAVAVQSTNTTATNLFTGPLYNTGSFNAVYAYRMQLFEGVRQWTFDTEVAGVTKTLTTIESTTGAPSGSNVREGVSYWLNGNLTGSLKMPDPTTVRLGVVTGNTTGSAIFTAEDMFNVLTQNITTPDSIGNLLKNASTVQTIGETISSFKI
jgi:hypothetical protein